MDKKQTAVQWLGYELNTSLFYDISPDMWEKVNELFKQALQMEREQIVDAFKFGEYPPLFVNFNAEQYYNETYGGQDER